MKTITIIGGGLAGLSLGIALRKRSVPVILFEAGEFPRHKVCGEFMAGVTESTLQELGIAEYMKDAGMLRTTAWFYRNRLDRKETLPRPAIAISRYTLDNRMAEDFRQLGGDLRTGSRFPDSDNGPGRVWASGRRRGKPVWLGLKVHCRNFPLQSDLELHLGNYAYAGASPVDRGRVNICGLFRRRPEIKGEKANLLRLYLVACGLNSLADRLDRADIDPESISAVAGIDFARPRLSNERLCLGDQYGMIAPFTGNGMSMALESAALATDPITAYAKGKECWTITVKTINMRIRKKFRIRLCLSRAIHPMLYHPGCQLILVMANRARLLPFRTLYNHLH